MSGIELGTPWEELQAQHGKKMSGVMPMPDGVKGPGRETIKTRSNAPHIVIAIPVGDKEETEVLVDPVKKERRVMQGYRYPGLVPAELLAATNQVAMPPNISSTMMCLKNNISGVLREIMTGEALEIGANFIFYWDDDVIPPPDVLFRMLNAMARNPDVGVITGVVWTKTIPTEPLIYKDANRGAYWGFNTDREAPLEDIYAAGAGCMMARVQAIRKMEPPYWHDEYHMNAETGVQGIGGHDIRFLRKMRDETGYRVCVDGNIQCRHLDIKNQLVFVMPPDRPTTADAREVANDLAGVTEEERAQDPGGPDENDIMFTAQGPVTAPKNGNGKALLKDEYVEPEHIIPDAPLEEIREQVHAK